MIESLQLAADIAKLLATEISLSETVASWLVSNSVHENGSGVTELSSDQIAHLLKDTNEISKLLRKWQSQQMDEAASTPWTEDDKLRKSVSDLVESEVEFVRVWSK